VPPAAVSRNHVVTPSSRTLRTVLLMSQVWITTPRAVRLSGTLQESTPAGGGVAPDGCAVLFAHGFLAERSSRGRADVLAAAYREAGFTTLQFDFSGCGDSEDDVVEVGRQVQDLAAASTFLAAAGWPRQVVHGHSLGALVALRTSSPYVEAMVLTGGVTGPIHHPWEHVLSPEQLADLETTGRTTVLDDGPSARQHHVISRQTLTDFSDVDQPSLLAAVALPVLLVHGGALVDGEEHPLLTRSRVGLPMLPAGSRLEVVRGADHALLDYTDHVARLAVQWLAEVLEPEA
jgi:putative redox protein